MYKRILVALDNSPYSEACSTAAVSLAKAFDAELVGCHIYAARMHERRFRQMEATLPEDYLVDEDLERQRTIHDSLIALGLRLISDSYLDTLERRWTLAETAVQHAIEFFASDCEIPNIRLLPTEYLAIVPAIVMHKRKGVLHPGEAEALRHWVCVAGAFAHYSGSTETTLGTDLNQLNSSSDGTPFSKLLREAQSPRTPGSRITSLDLQGKTVRSPFLRLLQLRAVQSKAHSWWSHRALSYGSTLPSLQVEVHHIFPKAWLRSHGFANHAERDTIANFAFLSKYDNIQIGDSSPEQYLTAAQADELAAQWVPQDRTLWTAEAFSRFCEARRELLANALNEMLGLSVQPEVDASEIPDEIDEPELGAWAEELERAPDAA